MPRTFYVYILASRSRNLYVGVTSDLMRRLAQHRAGASEHTRRYRITRLVYTEWTNDARAAVAREKQLKSYSRAKRVRLIETINPAWNELAPLVDDPSRCDPARGLKRRATADPSLRSG